MLVSQYKSTRDTATQEITPTLPPSIAAHLDRRGPVRLRLRGSHQRWPKLLHRYSSPPKRGPQVARTNGKEAALGSGGSGKCSPTTGKLWLAGEDAKRHSHLAGLADPAARTRRRPGPQGAGVGRQRGRGRPRPGVPCDQRVERAGGSSAGDELGRGGAGRRPARASDEQETLFVPRLALRCVNVCQTTRDVRRPESLSGRVYFSPCVILPAVGCGVIRTWRHMVLAYFL